MKSNTKRIKIMTEKHVEGILTMYKSDIMNLWYIQMDVSVNPHITKIELEGCGFRVDSYDPKTGIFIAAYTKEDKTEILGL
jgi:hypothetical protein